MNILQKQKNKGFTLIELLLYTGITALMLLTISLFLALLMNSRIKSRTVAEVELQGSQIMQLINQTIRNATAINSPSQGTSAAQISISATDASKNPTIFSINGDSIYIQEGANPAILLTSGDITISNLSFYNMSKINTPGIIRTQFTLSYSNASNRNEYSHSKTFYGSASLK